MLLTRACVPRVAEVLGLVDQVARHAIGISRAKGGATLWAGRGKVAARASMEAALADAGAADADAEQMKRALKAAEAARKTAEAEATRLKKRMSTEAEEAQRAAAAAAAARAEEKRASAAQKAAERIALLARLEAQARPHAHPNSLRTPRTRNGRTRVIREVYVEDTWKMRRTGAHDSPWDWRP